MSVNSQMYRTDIGAALRYLISYIRATSESVMPAMILEYDRESHKATIQPLVKIKVEENNKYRFLDRPPIKDISVRNIFIGGFSIDFPLKKGDTGWLIAADRDCTIAKERNSSSDPSLNEGPQEPLTDETHMYQFGFFIPDNWGKSNIPSIYKDDLLISTIDENGNSNLRISISSNGELKISSSKSSGSVVIDLKALSGQEVRFRKQSRVVLDYSGNLVPVSSIVLSTSDDYINV